MDLELLVIGATSAGWQGAVTAAQAGINVALVVLPHQSAALYPDLRQLPDEFLQDLCSDWLRRSCRKTTDSQEPAQWRQFAAHVIEGWNLQQEVHREEFLADGGRLWKANAEFLDAHNVQLKASCGQTVEVSAEHILLATGTCMQHIPCAAQRMPNVHDAAALLNASAIPRTAMIVGGGVTGLRAACILAWWGSSVTVIDGHQSAGELLDEDTIDWFNWAEELGVHFECGEDVIAVEETSARHVTVILESGRQLTTDSVWLATRRCGETDNLHLDRAGITTDDRGRVWCNDLNRTWADSISAVGDVVGFCPAGQSESEVARQLVESLFELPSESCGERCVCVD